MLKNMMPLTYIVISILLLQESFIEWLGVLVLLQWISMGLWISSLVFKKELVQLRSKYESIRSYCC